MKKVFVGLLLIASVASGMTLVDTSRQNLTGTAPTAATDGISLLNATGYTVTVSADSAQTITGGSLLCYYLGAVNFSGSEPTMRWMRCPTGLDCTPATGARDASCGDFEPLTGFGKIKYIPSSITVSGGTQVDVTITVKRP